MAKTPAKRKVAITFEDDDDEEDGNNVNDTDEINGNDEGIISITENNGSNEETAAHAHGTDADNNNHVTMTTAVAGAPCPANDPTITKTPISSASNYNSNSDNRTPGSSGGMIMRSGKKKKRPKPSGATNDTVRRAQKRTKLLTNTDKDEENDHDEDGEISSVEGMEEAGDDLGDEVDGDIPSNTNDIMVGQPVVNGSNSRLNHHGTSTMSHSAATTTTTAQKVPPATTREAIAAAQVSELKVDEEGEEEYEQDPATTAATNTSVGGGIVRLLSQKLRLPSQHTPKHPTFRRNIEDSGTSSIQSDALDSQPPPPPPPGGRRLIFETASKTTTTATAVRGAATATTTTTAGGGKNKLLLQTRQQQKTVTKKSVLSSTTAQSLVFPSANQTHIGRSVPQVEEHAFRNETTTTTTMPTSLQTHLQREWQQNKHQLMLYTQRWFVFLLICVVASEVFLVSTMRNVNGGKRDLTTTLKEWHGVIISPFGAISTSSNIRSETHGGGETSKHVVLTDPVLLAKARAVMRADRMNHYDIQKLEQDIVKMQENLNILENVYHGWTVEYPDIMDIFEEEKSTDKNKTLNESVLLSVSTFLDNITSVIDAKQKYLLDWEMALLDAEQALDAYDKKEIPPSEVNNAMSALSRVSMMKFDRAMILDLEEGMLVLPGEGCGGMDYIPLKQEVRIHDNADEDEMDDQKYEGDYDDEEHSDEQEYEEEYIQEEEHETEDNEGYDEEDQYDVEQDYDDDQNYYEEDQYDEDIDYDDEQDYDEEDQYDEDQDYDDDQDYDEATDYDDEERQDTKVFEVNESTDEEKDFFDSSGSSPVRLVDAQLAYENLIHFAESTSEALFDDAAFSSRSDGSASPGTRWARQIIHEELHRKGVDTKPPSIEKLLNEPITLNLSGKKNPSSSSAYTTYDAIRDIDHRLEIEDADRTGKFDYASVVYGARVLRRGPFATSYSYYETLPLLNRLLAYTKLRFYGHPPEVALYPTFPMHARGQCWSFSNEATSVRSRRQNAVDGTDISAIANDMVGEYATLTVSLVSAIRVSEIVMEHPPSNVSNKSPPSSSSSSSSSAVQEFRVLGFEDGGAFGEPWELGRFTFDVRGSSLQTFAIPSTLIGQNIPKLKAISIAIDSNWGAEYGCLYRMRVHGD